jgi:hypothetical protein
MSCTTATTSLALARLSIGILMSAAGVSKLLSRSLRESLHEVLQQFGVHKVPLAVSLLAVGELALGGWLVSGDSVSAAAVTSSVVLSLFCVALIVLAYRGFDGSCGCFLGGGKRVGIADVVRNGVFLAVSVPVSAWPRGNQCLSQLLRGTEADVWVIATVLTACFVGASAIVEQIRRLMRPMQPGKELT